VLRLARFGLLRSGGAVEKSLGFLPRLSADPAARGSRIEVAFGEVNSTVTARYSRLIRSGGEGRPRQGDILFGCASGLNHRTARLECDRITEVVTTGE
jgi:hypothetical protein